MTTRITSTCRAKPRFVILATGYAYDAHEEEEVSLVTHTAEVSDKLKSEIQERLAQAGVEVHGGES